MRDDYGILTEREDKAGYNTAADIAQVLGNLRKTHISAMISSPEDFKLALNTCRRIIDVISAKVPEKEITLLDEIVYSIEKNIPKAIETYRDQSKGGIYFKDVIFRVKIYRELDLYIESLKDYKINLVMVCLVRKIHLMQFIRGKI